MNLVKKVLVLHNWKNTNIKYAIGQSNSDDILVHLKNVDKNFTPTLSSIINLSDFSKKIYDNATRFEAWHNKNLIGLISAYYNDNSLKKGFINHVAIDDSFKSKGISKILMKKCFNYGYKNDFKTISLEVAQNNKIAINLYENFGFKKYSQTSEKINMKAIIEFIK